MAFAHFFSTFCGGAEVKVQTLKSASIPVLIQKRHRNAQEADIEDLRRQFRENQSTTGETRASVILNKRHPLVMSVMRIHQRNRQDALLARICDVMYRHAAVKFNLADEAAKGEFLSQTEQLLCEMCRELEKNTHEHAEKEIY